MDNRITTWKLLALIFLVAFVNLGIVTWPYLASVVWRAPETARYPNGAFPLIDPTRSFIAQDDFIVNIQPLREELKAFVAERGPSTISLYFEFLNTGANISINPDLKIWPTSLAKLPLAMAVMKRIEDGKLRQNSVLALTESDKDNGSGEWYKRPTGSVAPVSDLLRETLVNSDNTTFYMLRRTLEPADLELLREETGLDELFDERQRVSAKEYSRLLRALYTASFLSREYSSQILEWLSESTFTVYLASGISEDIRFAHKWGKHIGTNSYADAGIVYVPNRPYLITVLVQGTGNSSVAERVAEEIMRRVGETIYRYITRYERGASGREKPDFSTTTAERAP